MNKKKTLISGLLCFALIFSLIMPFSSSAKASPATIYVPDDYPSIQAAVDASLPGGTTIVRDGTYTENVDVNKDYLTIHSENGAESTTVQAANPDDHVFDVTADFVTISGFTVKGATANWKAGICLNESESNSVEYCVALDNDHGIFLYNSSQNTLTNNTASSNVEGIILFGSSYNSLTANTANSND